MMGRRRKLIIEPKKAKVKYAPVPTPDDPEVEKRCSSCAKNTLEDSGCQVLTERIGMNRDCSFWTDDPDWKEEAEKAVKRYKEGYR